MQIPVVKGVAVVAVVGHKRGKEKRATRIADMEAESQLASHDGGA